MHKVRPDAAQPIPCSRQDFLVSIAASDEVPSMWDICSSDVASVLDDDNDATEHEGAPDFLADEVLSDVIKRFLSPVDDEPSDDELVQNKSAFDAMVSSEVSGSSLDFRGRRNRRRETNGESPRKKSHWLS